MTPRHRRVLATILDRIAERGDQLETVFLADEVRRWPVNTVEALAAAKLLRETLPVESITCHGCEERCLRPVVRLQGVGGPSSSAISTCHLYPHMGPFEASPDRLRRWTGRRELIARFISRSAGSSIQDHDDRWRRVRFGTLKFNTIRRAFSLEFNGTPIVKVGSSRVPLIDVLDWGKKGILIQSDVIATCAAESEDTRSGNKRTQRSTSIREDNKLQTKIRNRRLQRRVETLANQHPTLNKERLAKKLARSGEFPGISWATIARLTRMPDKKLRRKNFASSPFPK